MSQSAQSFAAQHYAARAQDYVTSAVHAAGADLDEMEAALVASGARRVLDLGCGGGHVSYRAAPHAAEVVACDVTASMLEAVAAAARERGFANIATRQAAAEALPFPDASFDAVLCRFTTHHWPDRDGGLREARRVAKAGALGVFIDSVAPAHPLLDSHLQTVEMLRDVSHGRNYTAGEWVSALERAGFQLTALTARRLRMDFPVWIARTRAPAADAEAIRSLQRGAPESVRHHFAIGEDGSFDLDVLTMTVRAV